MLTAARVALFTPWNVAQYGDTDRIAAGCPDFKVAYLKVLEATRLFGKRQDLLLFPAKLVFDLLLAAVVVRGGCGFALAAFVLCGSGFVLVAVVVRGDGFALAAFVLCGGGFFLAAVVVRGSSSGFFQAAVVVRGSSGGLFLAAVVVRGCGCGLFLAAVVVRGGCGCGLLLRAIGNCQA